jgi:hypothetical protein
VPTAERRIWLLDTAWPAPPEAGEAPWAGCDAVWRAEEGGWARAYAGGAAPPRGGHAWQALEPLLALAGASTGGEAAFHYVVEASVAARHEAEFNAWYDEEHLPGLAAVPGTVRAARYRRVRGEPTYLACYDLMSPAAMQRPEWLAVRHTPWSDRVRPWFVRPRRTLFRRG